MGSIALEQKTVVTAEKLMESTPGAFSLLLPRLVVRRQDIKHNGFLPQQLTHGSRKQKPSCPPRERSSTSVRTHTPWGPWGTDPPSGTNSAPSQGTASVPSTGKVTRRDRERPTAVPAPGPQAAHTRRLQQDLRLRGTRPTEGSQEVPVRTSRERPERPLGDRGPAPWPGWTLFSLCSSEELRGWFPGSCARS